MNHINVDRTDQRAWKRINGLDRIISIFKKRKVKSRFYTIANGINGTKNHYLDLSVLYKSPFPFPLVSRNQIVHTKLRY